MNEELEILEYRRRGADAAPAQCESMVPFGRAAHRRPYGGYDLFRQHQRMLPPSPEGEGFW